MWYDDNKYSFLVIVWRVIIVKKRLMQTISRKD